MSPSYDLLKSSPPPSPPVSFDPPVYQPSNRVLLVEDEKMAKVLAIKLLKKYRLETDIAQSYRQVEKLLGQHRYCLVLMDVGLPGESGFDITQRLRKLPEMAGVPIVGLTAYISPHIHERAKLVGMNTSYAKPLMRDMADDIVAKYVPAHYVQMLADHPVAAVAL
jgi:CheY-like chemotaxis protein